MDFIVTRLLRFSDVLESVLSWTAAVIVGILTLLSFQGVLARYVFAFSQPWAEELLTYMMLWVIFLMVGPLAKRGAHIKMDFVISRAGASGRFVLSVLENIVGLGLSLVLFWAAYLWDRSTFVLGVVTGAEPRYPLFVVQIVMPLGMLVLFLFYLERMIRVVLSRRSTSGQ